MIVIQDQEIKEVKDPMLEEDVNLMDDIDMENAEFYGNDEENHVLSNDISLMESEKESVVTESRSQLNLLEDSAQLTISPDTESPPKKDSEIEAKIYEDVDIDHGLLEKLRERIPEGHSANSRPYCMLEIEIPSDSEVDEDDYLEN